ncbi:MAG: PAS domain S-box protein, partial [Gallionellaceae bacterium]|nr:PAS domain S-box protein [Gallionellaceae bacterium]
MNLPVCWETHDDAAHPMRQDVGSKYAQPAMNRHPNPLIDIATRDVTCLSVGATIGEAARIMAQRRFSSIVVTNIGRRPVGIVTERNILHAMRSGLAQETLLHTCMSSPVVTVPTDTNTLDAYQMCMREGIRHLVLVDADGAVCGVVSETDFRMHLNLTALAGRRQVIAMAQQAVTSLPPHSSLMQALNLMQAQRETCVIVVEDDKPVGIVTERDVVRFYAREPQRIGALLGEVMTAPVLSIAGKASVNEAAERMLEKKVRHLAVTDDAGRLIGLLSEHDLTRTMALGLLDERLEVDEMFLRTFLDTIPDLVWLKDSEGVYLACNRRFEQFFGAREKDIIGKTDYDFVDRELADSFREHDRKAMAAAKPGVNEEWITFASDGHRELLETVKSPMRDSRGKLVGVLGVARDITEREHNKRACLESEREFRMLAENMPDNLVRYDRECRTRYVNPAMARSVAAQAQPVLGETPVETYPGVREVEDYQQTLEKTIATGETAEMEIRVPYPDGELHDHHIVFVAVRDPDGDIVGALAIGRDITERERVKRALVASEHEFRALAENLPDNVIRYDRECRVSYMNPAMARSLAPELLPVVGKLPFESDPDSEQIRGLQRLVEQVMDSGERVEVEIEMLHPDRTPHAHHVIFVAERDENGEVIGALGIGRDISERKRADAALKQSLDEYSGLVRRIPVGVYKYRMRADGGIAYDYVSPRWCELLDVTEAEVMRDHGAALARIHLDELERFARLNDEARRNLRRFEWEGRVVRKDGEVRWLHIESQPTLQENGDILWDGIQYDVTDRRRVEETLRITASVFDNSREAIIITDADNAIIDVNPAFSSITGYSRDEVLGGNPRLLNSGRQDKAFYEAMWAALKQDRAWRGEIWNRR